MAGPEGDRTLPVRTLSGVQIPVPSVSSNASVQQLRQRIAPHFGASASCRLFLNGVKLSDKRTVDSLSLQPGHFLVAVQTQKRAESAPAPLQQPCTAALEAPLTAGPVPSATAAQQPQQQADAPTGAAAEASTAGERAAAEQRPPSDCNAAPKQHGNNVATSAANCHRATTDGHGRRKGGFLSATQQLECSAAFPATLLPGYTSRPEASPPATPPRQIADDGGTVWPHAAASDAGTAANSRQGNAAGVPPLSSKQPVRRRLSLPGLPPRGQRTAAAALAAMHSRGATPAQLAPAAAQGAQRSSSASAAAAVLGDTPATATPARASTSAPAKQGSLIEVPAPSVPAVVAAAAAGAEAGAAAEAMVVASRDAGLLAELAAELRGSGILQSAPPPPPEDQEVPADADVADAAPTRKPTAARRSRRSAAHPAAVMPAVTQAETDPSSAGAATTDASAAATAAAGTAAAPPGAALAAANAAVQEQWKHDVRFAPELTPRQAAAVAVLPVPDALEPLLHKFSVVTAVYGFLLRQHIQPSWRAVAAALPSMPGGAEICLADVELMARLAPDVLILRQDLGFGSPIKSMVQRRAAASAEKGGAPGSLPASPLGRPAGGAAAQAGAAQCDAAAASDAVAAEAGAGRQPDVDEAGQLAASPPSRRIISRPDIMGLTTDGAGTLMAGDADRRVLDIVDPGRRQAAVKVAGRALLGADSDEEEAGTESHSLGTSTATKPGQTAGGARNAAQRRNRAFRHALVRGVNLLHAAHLERLQAAHDQAGAAAAAAPESVPAQGGGVCDALQQAPPPSRRATRARGDASAAGAPSAEGRPPPSKRRRRGSDATPAATDAADCAAAAGPSAAEEADAEAGAAADGPAVPGSRKRRKAAGRAPDWRPIDFDPLKDKEWHPDFDVNGITVEVLLAALDAARAALPPLPQPPTPQPDDDSTQPGVGSERPLPFRRAARPPQVHKKHPPCTSTQHMGTDDFLQHLQERQSYEGQAVHFEQLPAREPRYREPSQPLSAAARRALAARGITRLFEHQAQAVDAARAGHNVVVSTSTASGKSLCYLLPVLEALASDRRATALFMFPTKALAQDQLRAMRQLMEAAFGEDRPFVDVYDGDTPKWERAEIRDRAALLITNPDMLHCSVLPVHRTFARLLSNLRYVVVDEGHAYRGVFGCHTALVLRRLRRICARLYNVHPTFVVTSATVANPQEHVQNLLGVEDVRVVSEDGSPHGPKTFVLWNPPRLQAGRRASGTGGHGGGSAGTGGAVNPLAGMPIMSRTEARARMKGAIGKRAVKEWKRNHAREAAQERSRGAQINPTAGVSEADMLAASAVGRRHELLLASAARAAQQLEQQAKAEQEAERQRQQEAEEAVRHAGPRAIEHDAQAPAAVSRGPPVPGNVLDPESTAAAAAAVAAAVAPQQRGHFGKAGRGRSYSNGPFGSGDGERGIIRRGPRLNTMFQPDGAGTTDKALYASGSAAAQPPAAVGAGGVSRQLPAAGAAATAGAVAPTPAPSTPTNQQGVAEAAEGADAEDAPLGKRLPGAEWRERCGPMGIPADERRSSPIVELSLLLAECVQHGLRTLAFCKTRKLCELVTAYTRETLRDTAPHLTDTISVYRAGYSPQERREIERALLEGQLWGVAATNAMELGVDIGSLDVTLHLGFPGSIASLWQQAGRAGRRQKPSASIYIAFDGPLDQFFMNAPARLFGRPIESAQIDPSNMLLLEQHVACAALETAILPGEDEAVFGSNLGLVLASLAASGVVTRHPHAMGTDAWHYTGPQDSPASQVSLRAIDPERFAIVNEAAGGEVMEEIEASKAFYEVYDGAVYMFQGRTYLCKRLDLGERLAVVRPADLKYYTKTRDFCDVHVIGGRALLPHNPAARQHAATSAVCAPCEVTNRWLGFHRIWHGSGEVFDTVDLFLPDVQFTTQAAYIRVPPTARAAVKAAGLPFRDGLHAASHAVLNVLPAYIMCAAGDMQTECDNPYDSRYRPERLLVYDTHPGGIGLAGQAAPLFTTLMQRAMELIRGCGCLPDTGCPGCVQHTDCGEYNAVISKESALVVLEVTLKAEAERAAASEAEDRRQQEEAMARRSSSGNGEGPV